MPLGSSDQPVACPPVDIAAVDHVRHVNCSFTVLMSSLTWLTLLVGTSEFGMVERPYKKAAAAHPPFTAPTIKQDQCSASPRLAIAKMAAWIKRKKVMRASRPAAII